MSTEVISERTRSEEEWRTHVHYLESMQQIADAIAGSSTPEQILPGIVTCVGKIFKPNRTWLLYPCDPEADVWSIPVEVTDPQYPGAFAAGKEIPIDTDGALIMRNALDTQEPVVYCPMPKGVDWIERFSIRSQMLIAVRPRFGKAWLLGMHQCTHKRIWTTEEQSLLKEIAVRLRDILSSTHLYRELQNSEQRLKFALEGTNDGLWDIYIQSGDAYFSTRYQKMLGFESGELEPNIRAWEKLIHPVDAGGVMQLFHRHAAGGTECFQAEYRLRTKHNEWLWVLSRGKVVEWDNEGIAVRMVGTHTDISRRKRMEESLRQSEASFTVLAEESPNMIFINKHGRVVYANRACEQQMGYTKEELYAENFDFLKLIAPESKDLVKANLIRHRRGQEIPSCEYKIITKEGRKLHTMHATRLIDFQGGTAILGIITDITELKRAEGLLSRFGRILDHSSNEIYIFDAESLRFVQVNRGARKNLGFSMEKLKGLTPLDLKPELMEQQFQKLLEPLRQGRKDYISFTTTHQRKDGSRYPVEVHLQLSHQETPPVFVAIIQDITERMQTREQLHYLAHYDALTKLPNRVLFMDRLGHALSRSRRTGCLVAVLYLDLDRFKIINDTLGHEAGDRLIQTVGKRLCNCVRAGDTVARLGGDEFAIVLEDVATEVDVPTTASKILRAMALPYQLDDRELFITSSIGISLHPNDGHDATTLLKHADTAMYRAKDTDRDNFQFYSADMSTKAFERLTLETSLRRALERQEFLLYYQPQVELGRGQVTGIEALLRWQHPDLGLMKPANFIPLLEDTGLIVPVGEWVLRTACAQAKAWQDTKHTPVRLAVNLSGRQFRDPNLAKIIGHILNETGLDPGLLELEITESVVMDNARATIDTMGILSDMGVKFAIDDFGTGYSSLSYLKRFPINTLKIDGSFVRDITTDPDDAAIVTAIVAMAHNLKLQVVAEGVETDKQLHFLQACSCDSIQGYLFSHPLPVPDTTKLLEEDSFLSFS